MGALSKRAMSAQQMHEQIKLFACPICAESMHVKEGSLVCKAQHSFDIAKQGYVNLMPHAAPSKYSKELFTSRKAIIDSGLYDPLEEKIALLLKDAKTILDTGCGEGSHLARIVDQLTGNPVGVGIDIAKEGIIAAAKYYDEQIWCVGDLAKSPFATESFDAILNILSPANYDEFKRLLAPGGCVIKIVPQSGYLLELRTKLYADSEKETYSNEQTVERFRESFTKVTVERITYTLPLAANLVPSLLEMTPMGWHTVNKAEMTLTEITIDLDILIGYI